MGLDYGERRIGVALSDPTGTLASPLDTVLRRRGKRPPIQRLAEIGLEHGVAELVMGLPLTLAGTEDAWCAEVRRVGDELGRRLAVPVAYVDERMTSKVAERGVRSSGRRVGQREQKDRVDAAAAAVILQRHLDLARKPSS